MRAPIIFLICSFIAISSPAYSQDKISLTDVRNELEQKMSEIHKRYGIQEDSDSPLTRAHIEEISKKLALDPNGPRMRQILSDYATGNDSFADSRSRNRKYGQVIKHIRGRDGVPFPDRKDIFPKVEVEIDEEYAMEVIGKYLQNQLEATKKQLKLAPLPNCTESTTSKKERRFFTEDNEAKVTFDMLYLAPEQIPQSYREFFGQGVMVRSYDPRRPDPFAYAARNSNVDCLPYRIRTTGRYVFRHKGDEALKNFDEDPNGKGKKIY